MRKGGVEGSGFRGGLITNAAAVAQSLDQYPEPSVARPAVIGSPNTSVPGQRKKSSDFLLRDFLFDQEP